MYSVWLLFERNDFLFVTDRPPELSLFWSKDNVSCTKREPELRGIISNRIMESTGITPSFRNRSVNALKFWVEIGLHLFFRPSYAKRKYVLRSRMHQVLPYSTHCCHRLFLYQTPKTQYTLLSSAGYTWVCQCPPDTSRNLYYSLSHQYWCLILSSFARKTSLLFHQLLLFILEYIFMLFKIPRLNFNIPSMRLSLLERHESDVS